MIFVLDFRLSCPEVRHNLGLLDTGLDFGLSCHDLGLASLVLGHISVN